MISKSAELGSLFEFIRNGMNIKQDKSGEGIPITRIETISDGEVDPLRVGYAGIETNEAARWLLKPGDILFSHINSVEHVGKCALYDGSLSPLIHGMNLLNLRPNKDKLDAIYGKWLLRSPAFRAKLMPFVNRAVNQASVSIGNLSAIAVQVPAVSEQKRIAAILDQADSLRRLRQRAIDRLNSLGQAIFHETFGDPATNPYGFERCDLGEIIEFIGGSQPAKSNFLYEDGPGRVRFVQIRDFRTDEYKTYVPKHLAKRPFNEDDVMIGRYGPPVFQIFRGLSGTYNVALIKAVPRDGITSSFVFYLLQERKLHSYVAANSERTAGQSGVNLRLLERYPAYKPPIELQEDFSRRVSDSSHLSNLNGTYAREAEYLFSSLQHCAFRGELFSSLRRRAFRGEV